jgi:hypothetical protein
MDLEGKPQIPKDLIEYLNREYPEACAEPGQTMDQLMFYGGKRDLVRLLALIYEEQTNPKEDPQDVHQQA